MMAAHFLLWFLILFLIEADACGCRRRMSRGCFQAEDKFTPTLNLDEDVQKEIARV